MPQEACVFRLFVFLACSSPNSGFHAADSVSNWIDFLGYPNYIVDKQSCLKRVRKMFDFAYSSYMNYAYPLDELDPIHCNGRGHDHAHPENVNVNDALGDFQLTLVDTLDTLAIMGRTDEFKRAVNLVINSLSFDHNARVQVFEVTIRLLGGLLSAHMLITDPLKPFGDLRPPGYASELLTLAHDLANRMLNVFDVTPSGLPYPRFYLGTGLPDNTTSENCVAGIGSLLIEFGTLSALLNDPSYAAVARRAVINIWSKRSNTTGLLGTTIDVHTGEWVNQMSGVGAGQDSFYEYLHKAYVLFGDEQLGSMFDTSLNILHYHLGPSANNCLASNGNPFVYWNLNMYTGKAVNRWIDSLQAVWPAILTQYGLTDESLCQHALHYFIWSLFDLPPERYDLMSEQPLVNFYPLRPEFVESTYHLYRATRHPFYLYVGSRIMDSLNTHARARCGFATIHNVQDMSQEDRMESFFLSETLKYLYLLFDESNPLHQHEGDYLFSTQAHLFPIKHIRKLTDSLNPNPFQTRYSAFTAAADENYNRTCASPKTSKTFFPLGRQLFLTIGSFVNSHTDLNLM